MSIYVCQRVGSTSTENNVITHTKTESSIRHIPIDVRLVEVFKQLFELTEGEYIFTKNNGEFMSGDYLSDILRHHTKGLLRAYTLRHQFSTDLLINGVDMRTIQELMGHTSSTMTLGYARSNDELKKKEEEEKEKEKEAENKAKNAIEEQKGLFTANLEASNTSTYISQAKAIELGDKLF